MEKENGKGLTKDRLVGMKVIDGQGFHIGEVKDIAFKVGTTPMSLEIVLKTNEGKEKRISWEEVQAAGDYVVLRPERATASPAASNSVCNSCGGPLTFVEQYKRWYCMNCKQYK